MLTASFSFELGNTAAMIAKVQGAVRVGVTKAALIVETSAKQTVPVRTGNLKRSIQTQITSEGEMVVATIGPQADYGVYVEFGTSRMAAQPYMRPALDGNRERILDVLRQAAEEALR